MLHADLGRVLDLLGCAAHHRAQRTGGHRAGDADFALAADFGTADRRVLLVENPDRRRGEQEVDDALIIRPGYESRVVMQHCGHDAGRTVGRRGDDAAAGSVLFVDGEGVEVDPIEHLQRVSQRGFGIGTQLPVQVGCAAPHLEAARQHPVGRAAALDALAHHAPDRQQAGVDLGVAAPMALVAAHHVGDAAAFALRQSEQFGAGMKRQRQHGGVGRDALLA